MKNCCNLIKPLKIIMLTFATMMLCSCSTTFKLPVKSQNMETVYLLKYATWGHHSLVFSNAGNLTEYTYGDWQLFALNKRDFWTGWKNMTFPTQGALGRKVVAYEGEQSICSKFVGCEAATSFMAPSEKVATLQLKLQTQYESNLATEVNNSVEDVHFVKHDKSYSLLHNCNHQLVEWLEELGGEVTGRVFYKPDLILGMTARTH